jgi:hypothetical protein
MSSLSADPWGSAKPQTYPYDPLEEDGHAADAPHAHAMEHDVVEVHCTLMEELAGNYLKHHLYSIDLVRHAGPTIPFAHQSGCRSKASA